MAADSGVDVVIRASVTAQELTFRRQPAAQLSVAGCTPGEGLRVLERSNLPARIEPGTVYRDVSVAVEILGRLDAACIAALAGDSAAVRSLAPGGCELRPRAPPAAPPAAAPSP